MIEIERIVQVIPAIGYRFATWYKEGGVLFENIIAFSLWEYKRKDPNSSDLVYDYAIWPVSCSFIYTAESFPRTGAIVCPDGTFEIPHDCTCADINAYVEYMVKRDVK